MSHQERKRSFCKCQQEGDENDISGSISKQCDAHQKKSQYGLAARVYREILGITGQNPCVSKPTSLQVMIFRVFFIDMRYILYISLNWTVIFLKFWTLTSYFSDVIGSYVTRGRFSLSTALPTWTTLFGAHLKNYHKILELCAFPIIYNNYWIVGKLECHKGY